MKPNRNPAQRFHGWWRAGDRRLTAAPARGPTHRRTLDPAPFLVMIGVAVLAAVGIAKVRARNQVLELGNELTELTGEHMRLLETERRLQAERAYLRHPDRIQQAAREERGMVPLAPEHLYRIRLNPGDDR